MKSELESLEEAMKLASNDCNVMRESVLDRASGYLKPLLGMTENFSISVNSESLRIVIHGKHELSIYNRYGYGETWCFRPEINWFGSSSTCEDATMLDYLIVVGIIAKDLKDPLGFCRGYLSGLMVELHNSFDLLNDLVHKKNYIIRRQVKAQGDLVMDSAIKNLKTDVIISDSNFTINKNQRHDRPFKATLKLLIVTSKTVTVNIYRDGESVSILTKRIPREEFLSKYRTELSEAK